MKKILLPVLLALGLLVVLTGCKGTAAGPSTSINVTITDFEFSPNSFTVPAGAQISFSAVNNGSGEHSFLIMKEGYKVQSHFTDADKANVFWGKDQIAPGTSITDTFTAPSDPGQYQIVCGVAGHFEAGMVATLNVVKP